MNTPTSKKERIISLDILRGFALLGILIINIQSFAMPGAAYLNPASYGDLNGINKWVWMLSYVFADAKMMAIFSMLFGAGVILVTERAEAKTGSSKGLHFKRTFWLLIFGLIHAHLIWHGDILVTYALCGMLIYSFRNKSPKSLIITGIAFLSIHSLLYIMFGYSMSTWPEDQLAEAAKDWALSAEMIQVEISQVTGTISEQIAHNSSTAVMMETLVFLLLFLWRATGVMLIGMALYKLGVLSARMSPGFYKKGMIYGWLIGFPLVIFGVWKNMHHDWSYEYSMFFGPQFNYWGSLGVSFGYVCFIMLMVQKGTLKWLQERLAAAGQMAFTNYIAQSVVCVIIFWGSGFGLFGQIERKYQILIVLSVCILQLLWSKPWLQRYRFGPLEWLWRSLTYGKKQPLKR